MATPNFGGGSMLRYGMVWYGVVWRAGQSSQYPINWIGVATICEQIKSDWLDEMEWIYIYTIACLFIIGI